MSNKRKRENLKISRADKRENQDRIDHQLGLKRGTIIPVDESKIFSRSVLPTIPEFYRDSPFKCKDCGAQELWTAKQQQRWYEEQGGEIEAVAIRCRACRRRERLRQEHARKVHLEGVQNRNETAGE